MEREAQMHEREARMTADEHAAVHAAAEIAAGAMDSWWRDHLEACGENAAAESPDLPSYSLAWAALMAVHHWDKANGAAPSPEAGE